MIDDGIDVEGHLPEGYHERMSILVNQIISLSEKALDIAEEFQIEDHHIIVDLHGERINVTIRRNEKE